MDVEVYQMCYESSVISLRGILKISEPQELNHCTTPAARHSQAAARVPPEAAITSTPRRGNPTERTLKQHAKLRYRLTAPSTACLAS
jgi:hypothetical protein